MSRIDFHEFNDVLLAEIKENCSDILLYMVKGGDFVWDTVAEAVRGEARLEFKPYELYKEGLESDALEGVIARFTDRCRKLK